MIRLCSLISGRWPYWPGYEVGYDAQRNKTQLCFCDGRVGWCSSVVSFNNTNVEIMKEQKFNSGQKGKWSEEVEWLKKF